MTLVSLPAGALASPVTSVAPGLRRRLAGRGATRTLDAWVPNGRCQPGLRSLHVPLVPRGRGEPGLACAITGREQPRRGKELPAQDLVPVVGAQEQDGARRCWVPAPQAPTRPQVPSAAMCVSPAAILTPQQLIWCCEGFTPEGICWP